MDTDRDGLVARLFHDTEIPVLEKKQVPKRAAEWVAGRMALKSSVRGLLVAINEEPPKLNEICIEPDPQGKPVVSLPDAPDWGGAVSLSHSNGLAMAAVAAPGDFIGLGIDLEKVEPRTEGWAEDYFTPEEAAMADGSNDRWLTLTMFWSLKEAALKALGTGLRIDLKDVQVLSVDEHGRAELHIKDESLALIGKDHDHRLHGRVEQNGDLVVARVIIRK